MSNLNKIYLGNDNPVVFQFELGGDFALLGLNTFTDGVTLTIGNEEYSTETTPVQLFIVDNTDLKLNIGDSTSLVEGNYPVTIKGFSVNYDDGYVLNDRNASKIIDVEVRSV